MKPVDFLVVLGALGAAMAKHDGGGDGDDDKSSSGTPSSATSSAPASLSSTTSEPTPTSSSASGTSTSTDISGSGPNSGASSTSSATTSSSSPDPSSVVKFNAPNNVTTCESASFSWVYDSVAPRNLTIVVTNERAVQEVFSPRARSSIPRPSRRSIDFSRSSGFIIRQQSDSETPLVMETLTNAIDARTCVVSWNPVDAPAGAYSLVAFDTGSVDSATSAQSATFFVQDGSDTSCINVGAAVGGIPPSSSSSPSPSADSTTGSITHHLSPGALGGIVTGIAVAVIALLAVFVLPRFITRDSTTGRIVYPWNTRRNNRPGAPYYLF